MSSGTAASMTCTPGGAGEAIVTATLEAAATGSDWGAGVQVQLRGAQGGSPTVLRSMAVPTSRQQLVLTARMSVADAVAATFDVYVALSGATACSVWNVQFRVEVIKR